jgi:hypothetical protein
MSHSPIDSPVRAPLNESVAASFLEAVHTQKPVGGLTHGFYRYPARFSPLFARATIEAFSHPGDTVLDPFMGGATSLVESRALGRHSLGTDISSLAHFVAQVKTTTLLDQELDEVAEWVRSLVGRLNLHRPAEEAHTPEDPHYQRHVPWPIRKTVGLVLARVAELRLLRQQQFARCLLLKISQWALDCRSRIPLACEFRDQFDDYLQDLMTGMREFRQAVHDHRPTRGKDPVAIALHRPAAELSDAPELTRLPKAPSLVLTSPPYPGVYVLYHRWKVRGRKESAAPFWLADCNDGQGQAYYGLGDHRHRELKAYFEGIRAAFATVRRVVAPGALVVQLLAFKEPDWQLARYLESMEGAGFAEVPPEALGLDVKGRLWRKVPGRRWFAVIQGDLATSQEVVLFHRPAMPPQVSVPAPSIAAGSSG